jgi:hypothetical protein
MARLAGVEAAEPEVTLRESNPGVGANSSDPFFRTCYFCRVTGAGPSRR